MAEITTFDYIIVGAGSAGCVLANRLSADPKNKVLLLEAGGDDRPLHNLPNFVSNLMIHTPVGFGKTLHDPKVNWLYETEPDPNTLNRTHLWPKGKVLGGSSSINGLLYIRGQAADYDGWRQMGCEGWSYSDVKPYFMRSEHQERGADEYHGTGGPLNVSDITETHPVTEDMINACAEAGIPRSKDINSAQQEGATWFQFTIKNGKRHSTATGYLHPVENRPNLKVETDALTARVLMEGKKAVGVDYIQRGERKTARANAEVILSAGSVASPQILELSGIGQGKILSDHGIPVVHELPGVGENMQDHYMVGMQWRLKQQVGTMNQLAHGTKLAGQIVKYALSRKGLLSFAVAHAVAFAKSRPELEHPDLQLHMMPASVDLMKLAATQAFDLETEPGITCTPCQVRPESRGSTHIKSTDPQKYPAIVSNYLSDPADQAAALAGMRLARRVVSMPSLAKYVDHETFPGAECQTEDEMMHYARLAGTTLYHVIGTTAMGHGPNAVVDPQLRVHGVENLRVVDAGIMPRITSGNTNAATIMIAEKASDMILGKVPLSHEAA
jgi:choline dehydrogenase-like flavoprotein